MSLMMAWSFWRSRPLEPRSLKSIMAHMHYYSYIIRSGHNVKEVYPSELNVEEANEPDDQANYLDLTFIITFTEI